MAAYLGSDGAVVCMLATGESVGKLRPYLDYANALVNLTAVERRAGKEELYMTASSTCVTCIEPVDGPYSFPYNVADVNKSFATKNVYLQLHVGSFVDVVLRTYAVEERQRQDGQPYLHLSGVDMAGEHVGPLRLWNFEEGNVHDGCIYILRGLKVALEQYWDEAAYKYVNNSEGRKTVICDARTAAEDVTDAFAISQIYEGW